MFLWSTGYVGARFGLPFADPLTFTSVRFAIVALLLGLIACARKTRLPSSPRAWGHLAVSGILIHACFVGGVFSAINIGVDISIAALIAGSQPLLTAILVVAFFGETLNRLQWVGFVVGFAGLAMVVVKSVEIDALTATGTAACLLGLFGITIGAIYQKRYVLGTDLLAGSAVQFAFALVPCALWALMFETGTIDWNLTVGLALAWLCLVLSIGAISILLFLIQEGAASRVSSLFYLVPPVTALQGYWFFGESLAMIQVAGILVAAFGVALINYSPKTAAETALG